MAYNLPPEMWIGLTVGLCAICWSLGHWRGARRMRSLMQDLEPSSGQSAAASANEIAADEKRTVPIYQATELSTGAGMANRVAVGSRPRQAKDPAPVSTSIGPDPDRVHSVRVTRDLPPRKTDLESLDPASARLVRHYRASIKQLKEAPSASVDAPALRHAQN